MKSGIWFARVNTDTSLSHAARSLLSWFGSQPPGWKYSVKRAQRGLGVGRQKYQETLVELKESGLVSTSYKRNPKNGQITHTQLTLHDPLPQADVGPVLSRASP